MSERSTKDPLQSVIAEILSAELRGEVVDRDGLPKANPQLADSLRAFFEDHDRNSAAAEEDPPKVPPS